jgi:dTDP-4-amino-4,6-dideoxygalactose transaminase
MDHLKSQEILTAIHYPAPVHLQPAYRRRVRIAGSMEVTERLAQEVLSLPLYPELGVYLVSRVAEIIKNFVARDTHD